MARVSAPTFHAGIHELAKKGLNLFACTKASRLPDDIREAFGSLKINLLDFHSLCLVGHGGKTLWQNLPSSPVPDQHPVDTFTLKEITAFNQSVLHDEQLMLLYPHSEWNVPLQKIGRFLNLSRPSALGLDINAEFGPWFAYRAAFLTSVEIPEFLPGEFQSPCESCLERPCQVSCPSGAVSKQGTNFVLSQCADYRLSELSQCKDRCLARLACPVGSEHRYTLDQIQYHMLRPSHLERLGTYRSDPSKK